MTSSQPTVQTTQSPTQSQSSSSPSPIQSSTQLTQILTFQEYLFYQGEPDVVYELFRGRLITNGQSTP